MGCGCSKSKLYTQDRPLLLGEDDGAPAQQYRTTVALMGLKSGAEFWAKGTGVAAMVVARFILPV